MKKIIFIRNLNSEDDIAKINELLQETRVNFSILLDRKAIVIEGNNDALRAAKIALQQEGYVIE